MTQEDRELLLKDLCARLPYGVKCYEADVEYAFDIIGTTSNNKEFVFSDGYERNLEQIKPYLRPMSSMTEEEKKELERLIDEKLNKHIGQEDDEWTPWVLYDTTGIKNSIGGERFYFDEMIFIYDWLNKKMFDYRGLIEKGLAIAVTEENNPYKE